MKLSEKLDKYLQDFREGIIDPEPYLEAISDGLKNNLSVFFRGKIRINKWEELMYEGNPLHFTIEISSSLEENTFIDFYIYPKYADIEISIELPNQPEGNRNADLIKNFKISYTSIQNLKTRVVSVLSKYLINNWETMLKQPNYISIKNNPEIDKIKSSRKEKDLKKQKGDLMRNIARIKQEIQQAIKKYFKNDKDILEYVYVDDGKSKYGSPFIEVRAELDYNSMTKLADHLDKIVQKYDKEAYFEQVEPGIMQVYFNGISESIILTRKLDKYLQNIKEESDIKAQIDQKCKKLGFTKLRNLFGYQEYIFLGNYNHSIVFHPESNEIDYSIQERVPGRKISYYEFKKFWEIPKNSPEYKIDHIFKEISKEFEGYE